MPHGASLQDWLPIRHLAVRGRSRAIDWQASLLGWGSAVWCERIKEQQLNSEFSSLQWRRCLLLNTRPFSLSTEATENFDSTRCVIFSIIQQMHGSFRHYRIESTPDSTPTRRGHIQHHQDAATPNIPEETRPHQQQSG